LGSDGIAPRILDLGTSWRWVVSWLQTPALRSLLLMTSSELFLSKFLSDAWEPRARSHIDWSSSGRQF